VTSTYLSYSLIARDVGRAVTRVTAQPSVKRETAYYLAHIGKVKTIEDFLKNDRLVAYATKAYGLADVAYAKGLIRTLLKEGVKDSHALANKLSDTRYKDFATAFNFQRYGALTTTFTATQGDLVDRYNRLTLEESAGRDNDGVRLALYFQRHASSVTSSTGILADAALLKVVRTAFDIPASESSSSIDAQARHLDTVLNIKDLQDPKKVAKLLQRFAAMYDLSSPDNGSSSGLAALTGQSPQAGIGVDLMMSLQKIQRGG
jgi:hypothetical protein